MGGGEGHEVRKRPRIRKLGEKFQRGAGIGPGYFDELGITVALKADTSDAQVQKLKDKVFAALSQVAMPFQWMVIFQRDGEGAGTLFPDGLFTGDCE